MLIKALCEYADKLEESSEERLPQGWSYQNISYRIMLTDSGEISDILDIRQEKKEVTNKGKEKAVKQTVSIILPERTQKSSIDSNIIEHRPLYIFGLNYDKGSFTTQDKTSKARKSHEAFVKRNLEFFDGLDSPVCNAFRKFLERWSPEEETQNKILCDLGKDYSNSYYAFGLDGARGNLEDDEQFRKKYDEYITQDQEPQQGSELYQCSITGIASPTARIHDKIKFPGGNSTGCVLVGMKEPAFESYGKSQSYNSSISEAAMKKYTSALNYLLSDKSHRILIDDMAVVFFAMKNDDSAECDEFSFIFGDTKSGQEQMTEQGINGAVQKAASGIIGDTESVQRISADNDVQFYIAGLTANSSRLCQKFFCKGRFGDMINNLKKHQQDMKIDEGQRSVSFFSIASQLKPPRSKDTTIAPPLMTSIVLSAINGTKYPHALLENVIRRIKTDRDGENEHYTKLNSVRAGIIKACLNRKYNKEEITMHLNEQNYDPAYVCGRLFAVLEKIQQDQANGKLSSTIKDSYFSSAATKPSSVLPKLIQLSQHHLDKLSEPSRIFYNKLVGNIIDLLDDSFPQTLGLDGQGRFIIGYYQQNKALYTTNSENRKDG